LSDEHLIFDCRTGESSRRPLTPAEAEARQQRLERPSWQPAATVEERLATLLADLLPNVDRDDVLERLQRARP